MQVSQNLLALVRKSEGLSLKAYPDNGEYSIGYGHRGVAAGTVWTEDKAEIALEADVATAAKFVDHLVSVTLKQGQFDALTDFVFNLGYAALRDSTLLKLVNAQKFVAAAAEFPKWCHNNGKVDAGLLARRNAEVEMFNS